MIKAIVTDIEGTTSSLSFVKELLFPYARERLAGFVRDHHEDLGVKEVVEEVRRLSANTLDLEGVISQLLEWSDQDRKISPLKTLQGMIWQEGYESGDIQGHLYEDAVAKLREWKNQGVTLYVFSSGSVPAQKLLFGHTAFGDLTPLFSGFFDTRTGSKKASDSYGRIVDSIGLKPREVLFLSDIEEELEAAALAGMNVVWVVREGRPITGMPYLQVRDFRGIDLERLQSGCSVPDPRGTGNQEGE